MTHDNKLQVEAIKRGTVIDHIPAQIGFKLLSLFKLTETDQRITIGPVSYTHLDVYKRQEQR